MSRRAHRRPGGFEYGLYYAVSFLAFLPAAALRQVAPARRDAFGRREKRRGVFGEAGAMAAGIIPFVFMH